MEIRVFHSATVAAVVWCVLCECAALPSDCFASEALACVADCDTDEQVTVSELIRAVSTALGELSVSDCRAADSDRDVAVTISELMQGVRAALEGCQHFCGDGFVTGDEECDDPPFRRRRCGGCCFEDENGYLLCADVACNAACTCVLPAACQSRF